MRCRRPDRDPLRCLPRGTNAKKYDQTWPEERTTPFPMQRRWPRSRSSSRALLASRCSLGIHWTEGTGGRAGGPAGGHVCRFLLNSETTKEKIPVLDISSSWGADVADRPPGLCFLFLGNELAPKWRRKLHSWGLSRDGLLLMTCYLLADSAIISS